MGKLVYVILFIEIACIICLAIFGIPGISNKTEAASTTRFETIYDRYHCEIMVDRDTNVAYLVYKYSNSVSITPLLNEEGGPLRYGIKEE